MDAAVLALHAAGRLRATRNGEPVAPGGLNQAGVKTAVFRPEQVVLAVGQKLAIRGLLTRAGIQAVRDEEQVGVARFLADLRELGSRAGGEPPFAAPPVSDLLDDLIQKTGNEQLLAVHDHRDELERLLTDWKALAGRAELRQAQWEFATALRRHATGLPIADEVGPELEAIQAERVLLDEMDRVAPQATKLAAALRKEVSGRWKALDDAIGEAERELAADASWTRLDPARREAILHKQSLTRPPPLDVSTDGALHRTLDERSPSAWRAETDAVATRIERARTEAVTVAAPEPTKPAEGAARPVRLRRVTLSDEDAVRGWLQEAERILLEAVRKGPVVPG